jgi:ribosomal protein L11 methyltransferase
VTDSLLCVEVLMRQPDATTEDVVESLLWSVDGIQGIERQDETTFSALVEDPHPRANGSTRWRIHFESDDEEPRKAIERALAEAVGVEVSSWRLDDLSFLTRWRDYFRPAHISTRVVVHPPWDVPSVDSGVIKVQIEPGMAFGTGTHETTRLCLRVIDAWLADAPGSSVFDVGCGSGVLAIAAIKLGAGDVDAVDNDADAVAIAAENARINEVGSVLLPTTTPTGDVSRTYDFVIANILPHILETLRDDLVARVRPGGRLLLSGILHEEAERMRTVFAADDVRVDEAWEDGEWCAISFHIAP